MIVIVTRVDVLMCVCVEEEESFEKRMGREGGGVYICLLDALK